MNLLLLLTFSFFTFSCVSGRLIHDEEYSGSRALYKQSEFQKSLDRFPTEEKDGFITSTEKSWISFWNKKGENSALEKQIKSLDRRQYTSISQEADYFFFNETEEGYIPSEHEVVALHLINAMIYMQQKNWIDAEVEARRASYFLQNIFNPDQPHFDDPALRLWLAAIWLSLDNWDQAQVDLRKIVELTKNKEIQNLTDRPMPPKHFQLVMSGSGPELQWSKGSETPAFLVRLPLSSETTSFSTTAWYQRHQKRNTVIRDQVLKSNYMAQYIGIKTNSGAQKILGFSFGTTSKVIGVIAGGAIAIGGIYLLAQSGAATGSSADLMVGIFGAAALVTTTLWKAGNNIIDDTFKNANSYEEVQFENLRTYRFVRFLPNSISFQLETNEPAQNLIQLCKPQAATLVDYVLIP